MLRAKRTLAKAKIGEKRMRERCESQCHLGDKDKALQRTSSDPETQMDGAKDRASTFANGFESVQSNMVAFAVDKDGFAMADSKL